MLYFYPRAPTKNRSTVWHQRQQANNMSNSRAFSLIVCVVALTKLSCNAWTTPEHTEKPTKDHLLSRRQVVQRQLFLASFCSSGILLPPRAAQAGEVGARINAAVTKSDLGISVRRSVVKGAQVMDGLDGQWEQFSDRFKLGANRGRQADKPLPKVIPPPQPLDGPLASKLLEISDEVLVSLTKIPNSDLAKQLETVALTVGPSFERTGLNIGAIDAKSPRNGEEFNFLCYTHYKAYTDLIIGQKFDFRSFQKDYEQRMGVKVRELLLPDLQALPKLSGSLSDPQIRQARWTDMQDRLQRLGNALVQKGLVAQIDMSVDEDDLTDWLEDPIADLQFNVALDGDVTLNSQILLQEQGFRLYANFGRYAIRNVIQSAIGSPIEITDYYMDTDYNSDPDKFQVKEVLLSIVLESE